MLPLFFIVWIIFNGRVTLEIILFGIAISGLMFAFVCRFMDYSMEKERNFYREFPLFCKYVVLLGYKALVLMIDSWNSPFIYPFIPDNGLQNY